jgi:hypothetical protein
MNAPRWSLIVSVSVATLLAAAAGRAQEAAAVIDDHLECYKIMDPLKLAASVDLNSPQFGVDQNCGSARRSSSAYRRGRRCTCRACRPRWST